jgi:hypothetical protein
MTNEYGMAFRDKPTTRVLQLELIWKLDNSLLVLSTIMTEDGDHFKVHNITQKRGIESTSWPQTDNGKDSGFWQKVFSACLEQVMHGKQNEA